MKKVLFFVIMFITSSVNAQDNKFPTNEDGIIEVTEVVEVTNNQNALFKNAQEWVAQTFGDYKSVIQFEDKENAKLILKGISPISHIWNFSLGSTKEKLSYTVTIECKDNKYRYKIEDIKANQLTKVLNVPVNTDISPTNHLKEIASIRNLNLSYQMKIDSIQSIDKSTLNKKQIKKNENEILDIKKNILSSISMSESELKFYNEEFNVINSIISSLKEKMAKKDEW